MSAYAASQIQRRASRREPARQRGPNYPWDEERTALAVRLTAEGVKAKKIADRFAELWPDDGAPTKCAVIGRVNRAKKMRPNRFVVIDGKPRPISQRIQKINRATANELARTPPTPVMLTPLPPSDIQSLEAPNIQEARRLGPLRDESGQIYDVTTIKRGLCHYPIGDPLKPGFGYCGRAAFVKIECRLGENDVTPYCADHRLLVYDPREDKRRDNELKKISKTLPKHLRS